MKRNLFLFVFAFVLCLGCEVISDELAYWGEKRILLEEGERIDLEFTGILKKILKTGGIP